MKQFKIILSGLLLLLLVASCNVQKKVVATEAKTNPFRKDNLIPWSIVGFDAKERTPQQRIKMLKELGYHQYAYGNRPKHQPTMLQEMQLAEKNHIAVKAVWLYLNLKKDSVEHLKPHSEAIFNVIKKAGLHTQIWVGIDPKYYTNLSDEVSLTKTVKMIQYISDRANALGCKIALYNHGGWFGDTQNQLKIIKALPNKDIGMVFNFHHAHKHLNTFKKDVKQMLPYLWCVNLNGMKKKGPKIITIGKGNLEKEMIQYILNLGYQGPFGILGHVKGGDAKEILIQNEIGLQKLFQE